MPELYLRRKVEDVLLAGDEQIHVQNQHRIVDSCRERQPGEPNFPLWRPNYSSNLSVNCLNSRPRARLDPPILAMGDSELFGEHGPQAGLSHFMNYVETADKVPTRKGPCCPAGEYSSSRYRVCIGLVLKLSLAGPATVTQRYPDIDLWLTNTA
ncbi:hypothetical protein E2C01_030113 [Portunus trituberculatus]|uniref:Uncharacterized protein n=1 Tax=Portunus trituberculatus TaxID=210409 RepID=A0A5B7ETC6_PORTR|nr:hypothetical protein [Portunus trituberculatus]